MATYNVQRTSLVDGEVTQPLAGVTWDRVVLYLKLNSDAAPIALANASTPEGATVERATATYLVREAA